MNTLDIVVIQNLTVENTRSLSRPASSQTGSVELMLPCTVSRHESRQASAGN